jgi:hypothetical protein
VHLVAFVSRLIPAKINGLGLVGPENVPERFNVTESIIPKRLGK